MKNFKFYAFIALISVGLLGWVASTEYKYTDADRAVRIYNQQENAYLHSIFFDNDKKFDSVSLGDIFYETYGTIEAPNGNVEDYEDYTVPASKIQFEFQRVGNSANIVFFEEEGDDLIDQYSKFMAVPVTLFLNHKKVKEKKVRIYTSDWKKDLVKSGT